MDYQKGKSNIRVELIENDDNLEGEEDEVDNSCCVFAVGQHLLKIIN